MKFLNKLKKVSISLKMIKQIYRDGGICKVEISQIKSEDMLKGKKVLITGGGSGIGLAIAKKAANCGASVVISGRNEDKLKSAVDTITSSNIFYHVWDISNVKQVYENLQVCQKMLGGEIDILVNSAGVQPREFFPTVTEKEWDRIYNINSKGTFFVTEAMCNNWINTERKGQYKKIITIDSQGGFVGATYPYRMSKWDLRGLTKGLGLKMAQYGVLVNAIAPGVVRTEMQIFAEKQGDNFYCDQNPLKRIALPEEVAELAIFMMSDACNFMVGQTILMDGGYALR